MALTATRRAPLPPGVAAARVDLESRPMKIAVCVKQVPDATVHKRHRPRHEAARPLRRGRAERDRPERGRGGAADRGGVGRERGRARLARPAEGDGLAAQGARDGRRPRGPRLRRRGCRLGPRRHELRAREGARAREPRPRPLRPAVERLRRRRPLGGRRRPAAAAVDLAGRRAHRRRRDRARQAADRVRLRRDRGGRCPRSSPSRTRSTSRATRR